MKLQPTNQPQIQDIEVTNACNLNCPFCARSNIKKRGVGYMTEETFKRIVNRKNAGILRHVRLFGHGEPLLHPEIVEFVRETKKYAKTVGFTTNATLLTKDLAEDLLKAGLTTICVSFEGTSEEAYRKLRNANFDTVYSNLLNLVDLKSKYSFTLSIACIDCKETHSDLPKFVSFWKKKADKVEVLRLHDWGGIHKWQNPTCEQKNEVCLWAWYGFGVYWNGDVSPCCVYEYPTGFLGNVNERSVREIWSGKEYEAFRFKHLRGRVGLPVCETCTLASSTFSDSYLRVKCPSALGFVVGVFRLAVRGCFSWL